MRLDTVVLATAQGAGGRSSARTAESPPVLLPVLLSLGLAVLGVLVVAQVALIAMRRLGLDAFEVLFWFGLAERPADELSRSRERGLRKEFRASTS